jgi:hypothetical protein
LSVCGISAHTNEIILKTVTNRRGGFRNSDSVISGSLASSTPPRGGRRKERDAEIKSFLDGGSSDKSRVVLA